MVEVEALLKAREPDDTDSNGGKHHRLRIAVTKIVVNDADVSKDLKDAQVEGRDVSSPFGSVTRWVFRKPSRACKPARR